MANKRKKIKTLPTSSAGTSCGGVGISNKKRNGGRGDTSSSWGIVIGGWRLVIIKRKGGRRNILSSFSWRIIICGVRWGLVIKKRRGGTYHCHHHCGTLLSVVVGGN